jgi:hypothetical protein
MCVVASDFVYDAGNIQLSVIGWTHFQDASTLKKDSYMTVFLHLPRNVTAVRNSNA